MNIWEIEQKAGILYKPMNYIYSMSIYHVLVIAYVLWGISGFRPQTLIGLNANDLQWAQNTFTVHMTNIFLGVCIVFIDMILFLILLYEFPQLGLTPTKILFMEVMIFSLSLYSPALRAVSYTHLTLPTNREV